MKHVVSGGSWPEQRSKLDGAAVFIVMGDRETKQYTAGAEKDRAVSYLPCQFTKSRSYEAQSGENDANPFSPTL